MTPSKYKQKVSDYKYISFDIFDTLLKRDVKEPTDVFRLVNELCQHRIEDFSTLRKEAEVHAREKKASGEVTLEDIYAEIPASSNLKELYQKEELDCELRISTPNRDLKGFYNYCVQHKKVVLVSDMYLPRTEIVDLLKKNEIIGYEKLYLSCDLDKTKAAGDLFDYVCDDLGIAKNEILHIGNAFRADYLSPEKKGIASIKVPTYYNRMQREYPDTMGADSFSYDLLNAFINNHVPRSKDKYFRFGYEVFGPLLYGFVNFIYQDAKKENIKQIVFLSRDGFIMKKMYDLLGLDIPAVYMEVSRRSLRVPSYHRNMSYEEMVSTLTVPNMTNIVELFDSFGLNADDYKQLIQDSGYTYDEQIKRDRLIEDDKFKKLFELIREDIFDNADSERDAYLAYIRQFDFSKPTALVDIGWGGSMQMYLTKALRSLGVEPHIKGYYVGLTLKSRENLGEIGLPAVGYAFDCLNREDEELESSYIGLIESMFLEQNGSVKKYKFCADHVEAVRYPYEYRTGNGLMQEAVAVGKIQDGALRFGREFYGTINAQLIHNDYRTMYCHMHDVGAYPVRKNIEQFGSFKFFNCGNQVYLASPRNLLAYVEHPKDLKKDIYDCQWKMGFLKALLKAELPYDRIYGVLRKKANS